MSVHDFPLELSRIAIALGLSVWIGGTLLAFVTAKTLFTALPSRAQAGALFGDILALFDKAKFIAAGTMLVGVLLEVQTAGSSLPARHVARATILFVLIAAHVYVVMVVQPKMRYLRERMPDPDTVPDDDPWRKKHRREHSKSEAVTGLGLLLAVLALVAT